MRYTVASPGLPLIRVCGWGAFYLRRTPVNREQKAFAAWLVKEGYKSRKKRHLKKFKKKFWSSFAGIALMLREVYEGEELNSPAFYYNPMLRIQNFVYRKFPVPK
jgi:hypothetical protein